MVSRCLVQTLTLTFTLTYPHPHPHPHPNGPLWSPLCGPGYGKSMSGSSLALFSNGLFNNVFLTMSFRQWRVLVFARQVGGRWVVVDGKIADLYLSKLMHDHQAEAAALQAMK